MNSLIPGYIDGLIVQAIKTRQAKHFGDEEGIIELSQEFVNVFNSQLYDIGPSKFMTMMRKRP